MLQAVLPDDVDELDPAVLSTLPPSLQLEFALKLRERKQAENREHFQKHTGQPQAFSSFQMQQYLKSTQHKYASSAPISLQAFTLHQCCQNLATL